MRYVAVLDACVLVPASLRDTLLRAAAEGLFRPVWSRAILDEVGRTLSLKQNLPQDKVERLLGAIEEAFPEAMIEVDLGQQHATMAAPEDCHVVALAIAGEAQVIVTFNTSDFHTQPLAARGVEVQTPDEFLEDLFRSEPDLMAKIIEEQAAALRSPPQTPADVLGRLRRFARNFVDAIERHRSPGGHGPG